MSVLKKFAGHTLIYGLSTIIARVLNFVLTPLFVNKFPAAVYGVFTNLYSWAALLNNLLAFGMETTYFRFIEKHEGDKKAVFNNSFALVLSISVLFILTVLLLQEPIAKTLASLLGNGAALSDFKEYVIFFSVILVSDALAVLPFARIRAENRPVRFATIKLVNILTFVGLNLFFIVLVPNLIEAGSMSWLQFEKWYRPGWLGYVFVSNLSASVLTLFLLLPELRQFRPKVDLSLLSSMVRYSWPILVANISFIITELIDKILLIPRLLPAEQAATDLGIYGAVSKLAIFLSIAVQAFRLGAEPFFFSYAKNSNARQTYAVIMDYFIILMVLAMVGLTANIEVLKYFIKSSDPLEQVKYWSGLQVIPVLLLSYVFLGIYTNLSIWYKLSDQTSYAIYISLIGAVITLVLNIIFIPLYSYVAAAWVTLAAYFSMAMSSYLWGQRNYAIPYHLKKNLVYIVTGAFFCWLSFSVFDRNLWVGNGLFFVFVILTAIAERNALRKLLNY